MHVTASVSVFSDANSGFWTDYSRGSWNQWQILATDFWAQWMSAFVAVCLTLTNPYVFRIVISVLSWPIRGLDWLREEWSQADKPCVPAQLQNSPESQPLLPPPSPPPPAAHTDESPVKVLFNSGDSREAVARFVRQLRHKGTRLSEKTFIVVLITALFGLFVAETVAGIFSAKIASDRAALSSSTYCGIWQFDDEAGDEIGYRKDLYNYRKEARASQYAQNCYRPSDATDSVGCSFFYNQSIGFETKSEQPCPFTSPELCLNGLYSAVTFDTGYVDAGVIGINSPILHKFRRMSSCSPLNMSEPYVQRKLSPDANTTTYHYYYGPKEDENFTYMTSGDRFDWVVPTYSVETYFSSLYPGEDRWEPLPKLKPLANWTLTIIFVSSNHIYHMKSSFDPIFPAKKARYFPHEREPYYYNSDSQARVLACADSTELCSPDGQTCWSMTAPLPHIVPDIPAYWFMKWSLENSNIYDSIKWRLGTALLAQEKISQFVSKPLPDDQWELEASQLFATSLARIQYDAWGIARGEDHDLPGYVEVTPDEAKGQLCRLYKFNSIGYTNINLLGFIGLPLAAIATWILSWEMKPSSRVASTSPAPVAGATSSASVNVTPNITNESHNSGPMIIDIIAGFVGPWILNIIVAIYSGLAWASRTLADWCKGRNVLRKRTHD